LVFWCAVFVQHVLGDVAFEPEIEGIEMVFELILTVSFVLVV